VNSTITKLSSIKGRTSSYWGERIVSQLEYGVKLSRVNDRSYDELIGTAVKFLDNKLAEEGVITKQVALETEKMLAGMSEAAKKLKVICAAHAHIDMNWMWGYAETVAVTLDTFRTMLNLMKEYPEFTFSQSQASVYKIIEEHNPDMLEEIKKRVKEGRWEVTASTWVETDKNMPNGESLARHILYTKKYLSELLDICPDSLKIDFEPDTFGHNLNVPEILNNGGVKYYYHCRGYDKRVVYRWKSPSGNSILVYRDPFWYNAEINPSLALYVPEFCAKHGIDTMFKVYGVGDHGGGPTRRDIDRIIDMASWPVFPQIKFGTFTQYFAILDTIIDKLPVEDKELNFIFPGCYTSQSRIKMSNRIGEAKLNEAEAFSTISAAFAGGKYSSKALEEAWRKVLFNHFHDILPGSGVIDTREYAMGKFQEVLATANTEIYNAFRNIVSQADTTGLLTFEEDITYTMSEGAGVGFAIKDFGVPQTERGKGKGRIFHFFNSSAYERIEPVEIVVWDWPGDKNRMFIKDASGNPARYQLLKNDKYQFFGESYWGHTYIRVLVDVKVPAYGYTTYTLIEKEMDDLPVALAKEPRVEEENAYILENDHIKVTFDTRNASIISIVDKKSGEEMVSPNRPAGNFRLIEEDDSKGMTSWVVGRYMQIFNLNEMKNVKIRSYYGEKSALRQWISYSIEFRASKLNVTVSLDYNSSRLNYVVECDWQEKPEKGKFVPQLNFYMPLNYECRRYKYNIAFGTIEREALNMDVPANSWMAGISACNSNNYSRLDCKDGCGKMLMLITDTKYGFRGYENSLAVSLIRSSYDPDPYPESGIHKFKFAVDVVDISFDENAINNTLIRKAYEYNHPVHFISGTIHEGTFPIENSFISLESGTVAISAVKMPEVNRIDIQQKESRSEGSCSCCEPCGEIISWKSAILRAYETEGRKTRAVVKFAEKVAEAFFVDINEKPLEYKVKDNNSGNECCIDNCNGVDIDGVNIAFDVNGYSVASVYVKFETEEAEE